MRGRPPYAGRVATDLTLLDTVAWRGEAIGGARPAALLAALALHPTGLGEETLADLVWPGDRPANPGAALQVLVSRVRSVCGSDAVARVGSGYRLALATDGVDAWALADRLRRLRAAVAADDLAQAAAIIDESGALVVSDDRPEGAVGHLRDEAASVLHVLRLRGAVVLSRVGRHAEALPVLEALAGDESVDEDVVVAALRSTAEVRGASVALERFDHERARLRDRLGTDPGPALAAVHAELLAADSPVRSGVRYDGTELLGRDDDLVALRTLLHTGRVTSIVGAGGLGKTRLANVLARESTLPRVHVIELAGVGSPDDVVGEVGSALGVRDSVAGRRALTPAQRADVRGRIAQQLATAPTLLVLDNCEHLVDAVAGLVSFLVVTVRDLRVLTTTRAPIGIAAERVYALGELAPDDAAELFCRRARAARPDVVLNADRVAEVVARLDGLPLAIELAAARTRVMSVEDVATRLQDRFALLTGGDRSAPDRHRTLLAVIDWSWRLLAAEEQRALCRLSVFHDGFSIDGAEHLLGPAALDLVTALVDQSLLTVVEGGPSVRYRMLETVREFGQRHLTEAGPDEVAATRAAQDGWATAVCARATELIWGPEQVSTIDLLRAEETNLAEVLRRALGTADAELVARLLAALGIYWAIVGDHFRVIVVADAAENVLEGWEPPDDLRETARLALAVLVTNAGIAFGRSQGLGAELLERLGPGSSPFVVIAQCVSTPSRGTRFPRLETVAPLFGHPDRQVVVQSLQWAGMLSENEGDPDSAAGYVQRALDLCDPSDGPWQQTILRTQLAGLCLQRGDVAEAAELAAGALPMLRRLHATDDALQLRAILAVAALWEGRLDDCAELVEAIVRDQEALPVFGGTIVVGAAQAELALARGDLELGLRRFDETVEDVRGQRFPGIEPTGFEPWTIFAEGLALAAHARYGSAAGGSGDDSAVALRTTLLDRCRRLLHDRPDFVDYPVTGVMLAALAAWGLFRGGGDLDAVRLLALARAFAYSRGLPSLDWGALSARADELEPGRLAELLAEYGGRRGPELLDAAEAAVS